MAAELPLMNNPDCRSAESTDPGNTAIPDRQPDVHTLRRWSFQKSKSFGKSLQIAKEVLLK